MASCPECKKEISEGSEICIHCGAKFNSTSGNSNAGSANNPKEVSPSSASNDNPAKDEEGLSLGGVPTLQLTRPPLTMKLSADDLERDDSDLPAGDEPEVVGNTKPVTSPDEVAVEEAPGEEMASPRSKWLEEQDKIKKELEALKTRVSKDFGACNWH